MTWPHFTGREELVFVGSMDQTWIGPGAEESPLIAQEQRGGTPQSRSEEERTEDWEQ